MICVMIPLSPESNCVTKKNKEKAILKILNVCRTFPDLEMLTSLLGVTITALMEVSIHCLGACKSSYFRNCIEC